jgi:hypothetical protein
MMLKEVTIQRERFNYRIELNSCNYSSGYIGNNCKLISFFGVKKIANITYSVLRTCIGLKNYFFFIERFLNTY